MAEQETHAKPASGRRCPICAEPTDTAYRPFCSRRCRDVDLGRWLGGGYVIAGGQQDADEDGDEDLERALRTSSAGTEDDRN